MLHVCCVSWTYAVQLCKCRVLREKLQRCVCSNYLGRGSGQSLCRVKEWYCWNLKTLGACFFGVISYTQVRRVGNLSHLFLQNCPQYCRTYQSPDTLHGELCVRLILPGNSGLFLLMHVPLFSSTVQGSFCFLPGYLQKSSPHPPRQNSNTWHHGPPCLSPYTHKPFSSYFLYFLIYWLYQPFGLQLFLIFFNCIFLNNHTVFAMDCPSKCCHIH